MALANGENVTVTYTDTNLGSLTVVKDAVPNHAQDFTFDPSDNLQVPNILLDDDADATLSNTKLFPSLLPGTYTVQETTIPAGWSLTNIVVTGAVSSLVTIGTDSDFDVGHSLVTVALVAGENVTITYTDTKLGSLTVVKDAVPNRRSGFHVRSPASNLQAANSWLWMTTPTPRCPTRRPSTAAAGSYTVQEISIPPGWSLTNIVVSPAPYQLPWSRSARTATSTPGDSARLRGLWPRRERHHHVHQHQARLADGRQGRRAQRR